MDKTIRRVVDVAEQDAENYCHWQRLSIGERIIAISEMSAAAYRTEGLRMGMTPDQREFLSVLNVGSGDESSWVM